MDCACVEWNRVDGGFEPGRDSAFAERYRTIIEKAPIEVRREVATFGLTDTEYELMKKMKQTFDPEGRLNPGGMLMENVVNSTLTRRFAPPSPEGEGLTSRMSLSLWERVARSAG